MEEVTDEALVLDYARSSNRDALGQLMRRRWPDAYRLSLRVLGEPEAAEDAAQEAFVALVRHAGRFQAGRTFGPWFRTLVMNAARKSARATRTRGRYENRYAERRAGAVVSHEGERRLAEAEVTEHLQRLPFKVRFPLVLHFFEGCSFEEVAAVVGCPKPTVQTRIRAGLDRLRESLAGVGCATSIADFETWFVAARATDATIRVPAVPSVALVEAGARKVALGALAVKIAAAVLASALVGVAAFGAMPPGGPQRNGGAKLAAAPPVSAGGGAGEQPVLRGRPSATPNDEAGPEAPIENGRGPGGDAAPKTPAPKTPSLPSAAKPGLVVLVRDRKDAPVAGAEVLLEKLKPSERDDHTPAPDWDHSPVATTDKAGGARFDVSVVSPRDRAFVFACRGLDEGHSELVRVGQPGESEVAISLEASLPPRAGHAAIVGHARSAGKPLARTKLEGTWRYTGGGVMRVEDVARRTDEEGRFVLRDLEVGAYEIEVAPAGFVPQRFEAVVASGQVLEHDLDFESGAIVTGRISLPPGANVAEVKLTASQERSLRETRGEILPDGTYRVIGLGVGKYTLVAHLKHWCSPASVTLSVEGTTRIDGPEIQFGRGATVAGRVLAQDGTPWARQPVRFGVSFLETDVGGSFSIRGVSEDSYTLEVQLYGNADRNMSSTVLSREVEVGMADVALGDIVVPVKLRTFASRLSGHVIGPDGKPAASAVVFARPGGQSETDAEGRFVLEGLEAGEPVKVAARSGELVSDAVTRTVDPVTPAEVALTLAPGGTIRGKVQASKEWLATGELQIYVSAEGESLHDHPYSQAYAQLDADGGYSVLGLPPGDYSVCVPETQSYRQVHVDAGSQVRADFSLGSLVEHVHVVLECVLPLSGNAGATWGAKGDDSGGCCSARSLIQNEALLDHVSPGPIELDVDARARDFRWCFKRSLVVTPGVTTEVKLAFITRESAAILSGKVASAPEHAWVYAFDEGFRASGPVDADGSFKLPLRAGTYHVVAVGSGVQPDAAQGVLVDVKAGQETKLDLAVR